MIPSALARPKGLFLGTPTEVDLCLDQLWIAIPENSQPLYHKELLSEINIQQRSCFLFTQAEQILGPDLYSEGSIQALDTNQKLRPLEDDIQRKQAFYLAQDFKEVMDAEAWPKQDDTFLNHRNAGGTQPVKTAAANGTTIKTEEEKEEKEEMISKGNKAMTTSGAVRRAVSFDKRITDKNSVDRPDFGTAKASADSQLEKATPKKPDSKGQAQTISLFPTTSHHPIPAGRCCQHKNQPTTPLFFSNLEHLRQKIFTGQVSLRSKKRNKLQTLLANVGSVNSNIMPTFVSPRKFQLCGQPSEAKDSLMPPLLDTRRQLFQSSFFAGSDDTFPPPNNSQTETKLSVN